MSAPAQIDSIDPWIKSLPLEHLQLASGGRPSLATKNTATIGNLLEAVEAGALQRSSPTAAARIKRTINLLVRAVATHHGAEGWDTFRKSRPAFRSYQAIYFASPRLHLLSPAEKKAPLGRMQFSRRVTNALGRAGITSIGVLVTRAQKGLVNLRGMGQSNAAEIVQKLDAFAGSTQADGSVDWISFARRCGFKILPEHPRSGTPAAFIMTFPRICDSAVASTLSNHTLLALRERLLRSADEKVVRRRVAAKLGEHHETVRQDEQEIVETLGRAIWAEDYRSCRFRFRREFLVPLFALKKSVESGRSWESALAEAWQANRADVSTQECVLVRLLGRDAAWARSESSARRDARKLIHEFMRQFGERSFTADELACRLSERLGRHALTKIKISSILETLPHVHRIKKRDVFEVAAKALNLTQRCERLLRQRGAPIHIHELTNHARGMAQSDRRAYQRMASLLYNSPRFAAIGKSGYWSLSEWTCVDTRTIPDVAADVLQTSARPMHQKELIASIRARRPVKTDSAASNLGHDGRFVRVGPATWTLRARTRKSAGRN